MAIFFTGLASILLLGSLMTGDEIICLIAFGLIILFLILGYYFRSGRFTKENLLLFFWFILVSHRGFIPRVSAEKEAGLANIEIGISIFVCVMAAILFLAFIKDFRLRLFEARSWLIAFGAFSAASLFWTPDTIYAGFWFIRLLAATIIIVTYFQAPDPAACGKFFTVTLIASFPVIILPIYVYLTGTEGFGSHRVTGMWAHPNMLSDLSFAVAAALMAKILQERQRVLAGKPWLLSFFFVIALTGGFLAGGKTGAVAGGVGIVAMLFIGRQIRLWMGLMALACVGGIVVVYGGLLESDVGLIAHWRYYEEGHYDTVGGRFGIWLAALDEWSSSIHTALLGRGIASARILPLLSAFGTWDAGHAHNSYVTLLLGMGLIGSVLFFAYVFACLRGAIHLAFFHGARFAQTPMFPPMIALVVLSICSVMGEIFGDTVQPPTYLLLAALMSIEGVMRYERRFGGGELFATREDFGTAGALAPAGIPTIRPRTDGPGA